MLYRIISNSLFCYTCNMKLKWLNLINWNGEKLPPTSDSSEIPEWMLLILHHWVIPVVHEAVCLIETPTDWQSWLSPLELTALPRIVHFEHQLHIKTISIVSWLWIRKTNVVIQYILTRATHDGDPFNIQKILSNVLQNF